MGGGIENRIQDVREYMGAIEKVLLGRVEGIIDQNQRNRRNIDQKMAQIQQVLTEELETRIQLENSPMCLPAPAPDLQAMGSAGYGYAAQLGSAHAEAIASLREEAERHGSATQGRTEEACRRVHWEGERWVREIRQRDKKTWGKQWLKWLTK